MLFFTKASENTDQWHSNPARRRQTGPADVHDGVDSNLRLAAGRPLDPNRRANPAPPRHRRGRRHDHDAALESLPDAGAIQLLRPPRAARERARRCPLASRVTMPSLLVVDDESTVGWHALR